MFENFWGNRHVTDALEQMIAQDRLSQTLLFSGPEGVGKATLARRLGARLLGHGEKIEHDDLNLLHNLEIVADERSAAGDIERGWIGGAAAGELQRASLHADEAAVVERRIDRVQVAALRHAETLARGPAVAVPADDKADKARAELSRLGVRIP